MVVLSPINDAFIGCAQQAARMLRRRMPPQRAIAVCGRDDGTYKLFLYNMATLNGMFRDYRTLQRIDETEIANIDNVVTAITSFFPSGNHGDELVFFLENLAHPTLYRQQWVLWDPIRQQPVLIGGRPCRTTFNSC